VATGTTSQQQPVRYIALDRSQLQFRPFDLEELIPQDHPARVIWELCGSFNLQRFEEQCKSREGSAGRPCWPPQLLVSAWIYSYTMGVASSRAIERMMGEEPGLRWLAADEKVNYHTLNDFRVGNKEAVDELFTQFLAMLETAGVVNLKSLLQDGTKVRAVAGKGSLHRRKKLDERLKQARKVVRELDRKAQADEAMDERRKAAQQRAAQEAVERGKAALEKLKKLEQKTPAKQQAELRVSHSEPEARKMKHADGSWAPSYNVQLTTEEQSRMVVSVGVTDEANDLHQLVPALERVKETAGETPEKVIADNGYATRENVEATSAAGVELIAPWKEDLSREAGACARNGIDREFAPSAFRMQLGGKQLQCPAGKTLVVIGEKVHHGLPKLVFGARAKDCQSCSYRKKCCGERGGPRQVERVKESPAMKRYLARMKRRETKELYGKRCEIAEFPQLWFKGVKHWTRFSVRGMEKARMEAIWVALAYNFTQWLRVRPVAVAA
jgi:transposase